MKKVQQNCFIAMLFGLMTFGASAQASDHWVSTTLEPDHNWQLHTRGGVALGTVADQIHCSTCSDTDPDGGILIGADALHQVSKDLWVGVAADFTSVIFGSQQTYSGVIFGQTQDFGYLSTAIFAEAGVHTVEGFAGGFLEGSALDSDWTVLPYTGARLNADLLLVSDLGLSLGVWSSLRMDLVQKQQQILVREASFFGSANYEMRTYRVGGLQAAGGVQLGITI